VGFLDGKLSVFRLGLKKNPGHPQCPPAPSSSLTHRHQQRYRKKRFHISPRALGEDFHNYNLAVPSQPRQWSPMPSPLPHPVTERLATDLQPETLSDLEVAQQPARRGMRICAWTLWIVLACIHYKKIVALWVLAARAWPGFY
jgi:hypothetical protein